MKKSLLASVVLGVTFVLGLMVGAVGMHLKYRKAIQRVKEGSVVSSRQLDLIEDRLARDLELTPEQAEAIREEIEATAQDLGTIRDSVRDEILLTMRESAERIESYLTPEQRERFNERVVPKWRGLRERDMQQALRPGMRDREHPGRRVQERLRDRPPTPPRRVMPPPEDQPESAEEPPEEGESESPAQ